ncbi:MAG: tRNA uridine-5-carboxymethylaminomethyl(34) synthesis GTPase MnmE, partial [Candidatus Latescibacterota bacterium]
MRGDTIAAISTPLGIGGIGIVRISGPQAVEIVEGIFRGKVSLGKVRRRRMLYGRIVDGRGEEVDEVLV